MSTTQILIAGFGGQGVLFAGKFIANKGLIENRQVSWLPSYGPEMRGGTANCNVILSDEPIGSPIIDKPDCLVAMNLPSLRKYEYDVVPGGVIILDSTLIEEKVDRDDVTVYYVPATKMARDGGFGNLANMILMGKLIAAYEDMGIKNVEQSLKKVIPPRKADLFDVNRKAVEAGYNFNA